MHIYTIFRIWQDLKVSADNEIYALGRLESCVFHPDTQKIGKLSDIEMPQDAVCDEETALAPFAKIKRDLSGMEYVYSHRVQYSDLDKSRHMANLRYVNLMENVFSPEFYDQHCVKELKLHYVTQSFYGDEIKMYKKPDGNSYQIAGVKADGNIAILGMMVF